MSEIPAHSDVAYEEQDVSQKDIFWVSIISIAILVVSLVLLSDVFVLWREHDMKKYVYSVQPKSLRDLRTEEFKKLHSYELIDSTTHKYRIPIDRAMHLVAEEAFQKK